MITAENRYSVTECQHFTDMGTLIYYLIIVMVAQGVLIIRNKTELISMLVHIYYSTVMVKSLQSETVESLYNNDTSASQCIIMLSCTVLH